MSSSNGIEEYYQKVIQLQERLRQSEDERLKLEMRFNEMLQVMKEEEEAHFKKLRTKYKQFLEEDRRRQQRNDKILEALDRIENRAQIWEAKTEKFKVFKRKYQDYLKHAGGRRSRSPLDPERTPEPKHVVYERPTLYPDHNSKEDDAKTDIMEKYLQSLSSQKCKDDVLQKKSEKPPPESKYSNLGNINSIYWKTPKYGEKTDPEKEDYDSTQLKNTKDMENALKQNNNVTPLNDYSYSDLEKNRFMEKRYNEVPSFERRPLQENILSSGRKLSTEPETKEYKFSSNVSSVNQNTFDTETSRRASQQFIDHTIQPKALHVHKELENMLKQHKDEAPAPPFKNLPNESLQNSSHVNPPIQIGQFQSTPTQQQVPPLPNAQIPPMLQHITQVSQKRDTPLPLNVYGDAKNVEPLVKNQEAPNSQILNKPHFEQPVNKGLRRESQAQIQRRPSETSKSEFEKVQTLSQNEILTTAVDKRLDLENKEQRTYEKTDGNHSGLPQPSDVQKHFDQTLDKQEQQVEQPSDANAQLLQDGAHEQSAQENDENKQYREQGYDESGQPMQQYTENSEPIQQYDENGQPLGQYDDNGQPLQQYDKNGQPILQYDENGQPLQPYYEESGQLQSQYYDDSGQPLQKYDENGQPLQQYYDNGQVQYDENGQPITQYDENGQTITQYDENGQPILPYDPNAEVQYDESGQPITQYDENGQPIQYDQTEQPLSQYDANGQPLVQYDENGQPIQQYYDENGQPVQYYGGESAQQYDENGQLLQEPYSEQPYDEQQQYYEEQQQIPGQQQPEEPQAETKSNVLDMLETDTESTQHDIKESNESDFDFSNS